MRPAVALVNWPGIVAASNGGKLALRSARIGLQVGLGPLGMKGGQRSPASGRSSGRAGAASGSRD